MGTAIHALRIRNFQSLHDVQLELAPFTVIVGPSSSGKSALTRAIRTLTSNRRGTEFITHGQRVCSISATTPNGVVTLTRSRTGSNASENNYTIIPTGLPPQTYAKLGGTTPQDVSDFLGLPNATDSTPMLQFASQFDKPYQLDDSAGEVARTLGALTNVNVIFESARESNRRKLTTAQTLRTRSDDLANIKARIPEFQSLRAQDEALTAAERHIRTAQELQRSIARLEATIQVLETTAPLIDRLTPLATLTIPDDATLLDAHRALQSFQQALQRIQPLQQAVQAATRALEAAEADHTALGQQYKDLIGSTANDLDAYLRAYGDTHVHTDVAGQEVDFIPTLNAAALALQWIEERQGTPGGQA